MNKKAMLRKMYRHLDKVTTEAMNDIKDDEKNGIDDKDKLFDRVSTVMDTNDRITNKTKPGGDGIANLNMHLTKIFSESEYAPKIVTDSDGIGEPTWTNHALYGCLSIFRSYVIKPLIVDPIKNADLF